MRLVVAGEDRSVGLGVGVSAQAERLCDPELAATMEREKPVLALRDATSESAFLDAHAALLRSRNSLDTTTFIPPSRRGPMSGLVLALRRLMWRLLRHQYEWLAFRYNAIHAQLSYQAEFERDERQREVAELSRRIAELEREQGSDGGGDC